MKNFYKAGVFLIASVLLLLSAAQAKADTLFSDGFESNNFSSWTQAGSSWNSVNNAAGAHAGSIRGQIAGPVTDETLLKEVSTSGFENISLSFWYKINQGLEAADHLIVEWSLDGSTWTTAQDITTVSTSANYTQSSLSLGSSAANQSGFRFRFSATLGATSDVVSIDDVELSGSAIVVAPPSSSSSSEEAPAPRVRSKSGRSRSYYNGGGQVLGASTSRDAQIAQAQAALVTIMEQFVVLLQAEINGSASPL